MIPNNVMRTTVHPQVELSPPNQEEPVWVDEGVADLIRVLWAMGFETLWSCEGKPPAENAHRQGYISMRDSAESTILMRSTMRYPNFQKQKASWVFEFNTHEEQGDRFVIRFPSSEIQGLARHLIPSFYDEIWRNAH